MHILQEATCKNDGGLEWDYPTTWETCTDTNYCPVPPNGEPGSFVYANSTGNRFGAVCRGSNISAGVDADGREPLHECPLVDVEYRYSKNVSGSAHYRLHVTTDTMRADKIFFQIQFDAPVYSIDFNGYNYPNLVGNSTDAFNDTVAMYNVTFSDQVHTNY